MYLPPIDMPAIEFLAYTLGKLSKHEAKLKCKNHHNIKAIF